MIDQKQYLAELERLLGFMSSWDRQAALKKYQSLFAAAHTPETLMEELGTPTKLAIGLAATYVPTPAPSVIAEAVMKCPVALDDLLRDPRALSAELAEEEEAPRPETWVFPEVRAVAANPAKTEAEELQESERETAPAQQSRIKHGALAAYLVPAVVIGLPVAVLLVCIGLPFLLGGAGLAYGAVREALLTISQLRLASDMLLTAGTALIVCAVGLLLCWFGLWLSMQLCWLWVGKALFGLGRRLCVREEAPA